MRSLANIVSLIFLLKTLILKKNCIFGIELAGSRGAGDKLAYEEYLRRNLSVFLFLSDISLLNVKISRAYN